MDLNLLIYYIGFALAIFLCRGLGKLFYIPMLLDVGFNLALTFNLLSGWDIRLLMVIYGFGTFLWVLALSGALSKTTFVAVLMMDLAMVYIQIVPEMQAAGTGQDFWNVTSTGIVDVWMLSIFVVVISLIFRSTVLAKIHGRFIDVLTNPRKRFLLPIGAWTGIVVLGGQLQHQLPAAFVDHRFDIGAHALVWGWVALELPFYLMYHRLRQRYE